MENKKNKILIVDDNQEITELISIYLEGHGYICETAANGKECLKKIETHPPDLILLDVLMPNMDGFEVLKK